MVYIIVVYIIVLLGYFYLLVYIIDVENAINGNYIRGCFQS